MTAPPAPSSSPRPRILVAEDDEAVRGLITEILASRGAETTAVPDGEAAVQAALSNAFDAAVLDIDMPGLNGLAACRRLRANSFTRDLPVLFLTGHAEPDTIREALTAGGSDFLPKPVEPNLLWLRVRNLLLLASLQRESERLRRILAAAPGLGTA